MKKNSEFFQKVFLIPTIVWVLISLLAMIPDENDPDPLTWLELISVDIVLIVFWFIISWIIYFIYVKIKQKKYNKEEKIISEDIKNKDGRIKIYYTYKFKKNVMIVLFVLTILSLFFALDTWDYVVSLVRPNGFNFNKYAWVVWIWLPIPILSIILGFKFKNMGFKCTKNIVAGFIVGFFLLVYGSFCLMPTFSEEYTKIYNYSSIIDAKLPTNGELEIQNWGTHFDEDKTNFVLITAYYSKEDTKELINSIENSSNWILSTGIKSELKIFIPSTMSLGGDSYFSIYNKTTNEYNKIPEIEGSYEIYTMKYDKTNEMLQISKFNYSYK